MYFSGGGGFPPHWPSISARSLSTFSKPCRSNLQARSRGEPIDEYRTGKPAPRSHHPFVGGAVIEANLSVRHEFFLPVSEYAER